jgi:hypothetical protein
MANKHTEYLFGIPLFDWRDCEYFDNGVYCFYGVQWRFPSMNKWDGYEVMLYTACEKAGMFSLSDEESGEDILCMQNTSFLKISEFKDAVLLRLIEIAAAKRNMATL